MNDRTLAEELRIARAVYLQERELRRIEEQRRWEAAVRAAEAARGERDPYRDGFMDGYLAAMKDLLAHGAISGDGR